MKHTPVREPKPSHPLGTGARNANKNAREKYLPAHVTANPDSPVDHFIRTYHSAPNIINLLSELQVPYDSDGNPRGLNRTTLAELAEVTYPVVHRTELAIFERIPPKLLAFMECYGHRYNHYAVMYKNYRGLVEAKHILAEREKARRDLSHWTIEDVDCRCNSIPLTTFRDWRARHFASVMDMAKVILINPTIIANYENGQTRALPVGVERQFRKFGMHADLIASIKKLDTPHEKS